MYKIELQMLSGTYFLIHTSDVTKVIFSSKSFEEVNEKYWKLTNKQ